MAKKISATRHWKQTFDKNADYVWRRVVNLGKVKSVLGDPIPDSIKKSRVKLLRFWNAGIIERADFEAPDVGTGRVAKPKQDAAPDYSKMTGKAMDALLEEQDIEIEGWGDMKVPEKRIALTELKNADDKKVPDPDDEDESEPETGEDNQTSETEQTDDD